MKLKMTGLALLAGAAVVAGCGGDDEQEALSTADYTKQANAICSKFEGQVSKDAEKAFAGVRSEQDLTGEKAREFFGVALPKFDKSVDELDALGAPKGDEDTVKSLIEAGRSDSKKIEDAKDDDDAIRQFVVRRSATPEFDKQADAFGLKQCGAND